MSLQFTLLTMLKHEPQTGYQIVKNFEESFGFFWQATHQQVYRELGKLSELELVTFKEISQTDKPNKKIYRITADGEDALKQWVSTPLKPVPNKQPLLVKLQNLDSENASELRDELNLELEKSKATQSVYKNIEKTHYTPEIRNALAPEDLTLYAALRLGIHSTAARIKWLEETLKLIDKV